MVEIIGLVAVGGLVWLLAWAMGIEADAERRSHSFTGVVPSAEQERVRHAA
jgi:hypothetical protein